MKKTTIVFLLLALIAGLFISCSQEITVDADVHNKINDIDTFCINGKYFSTLQAAVDYFKDSKAMKAPGDNDNVIYLTRNASGPGADIVGIQDLVIDFAGFTYSFTNVTAIQGETGGKFGLSITDGSEVTLKGLEQIDLFDSTADLTMVYIEGSDTSLTIEDAPKMVVEPTQYVFWAANGATLTIGSEDKTKEATITGRVAATGGTTEESKPTITLQGSTKVTGAVEVTRAEVEMIGSSKVTGSISTTGSNITVGDESTIKASLTASESSTVTIVSKDNVITNLDKTIDSKIITAEDLVVEEVSGDNKIETTDNATIYKDEQKETTSTDVTPVPAQLLAKIGNTLYETFDDALETVTDSTPTTIVLLGEYVATGNPVEIDSERVITIDLNGWDAGNAYGYISIVNNGYLNIEDTYSSDKEDCGTVYLTDYSGSGTCIITGGNYLFDPIAFVPAWCSVTKDSVEDLWTVALITDGVAAIGDLKFASIEDAFKYANTLSQEAAVTINILKNTDITEKIAVNRNIVLDLKGYTLTNKVSYDGRFKVYDASLTIDGNGGKIVMDNNNLGYGYVDLRNASGSSTGNEKLIVKNITFDGGVTNAGLFAYRHDRQEMTFENVIVLTPSEPLCTIGSIINGYNCQVKLTVRDCDFTYNTHSSYSNYGVFQAGIYPVARYLEDDATVVIMENVKVKANYGPVLECHGHVSYSNCDFTVDSYTETYFSSAICAALGGVTTVNNTNYSSVYGAYVWSSGGTINIDNGNFKGTDAVLYAQTDVGYSLAEAIINVKDGSFDGAIKVTGKSVINVAGGSFVNVSFDESGLYEGYAGIVITGGTFDADPSAYVAEGYVARKIDEGTWTVSKADDEVAVTIGSTTTKMSLLDFAKKVNNATKGYATANVELLKDVNLSGFDWTPIGTQATPFKGEFYGAGNTIKNLTVNVENGENIGIFGAVQDATIHDVSIENAHVIGSDKVGILIGRSMGGTVSISDVKIDNDSYAEGEDSIGGLIGSVKNSKTIIKNTSVAARVTATEKGLNKTSRAGGFVGADGSNQIIFDNCEFTGHCKGKSVAGFIAHCMLNNKVTPHIFLNCDASGELELLNVQQTDNYCDMGNLISAIWYGPSVFVIDTTVHGEEITEVSQGFGGVFGRVVDIDGGASVCYYIKNAESFISDFVSNTTYSGFAGSYEISVDNDYIVTVVAGTDFKIISGGTTVYLDAVSIIGTDGSKLTATIGTTSGNNGSFKVSGTNCNFFDNNGTPITYILSGYYDMSGNVIGYHNLVFDWDSTLNGWKLQQEYQHYYDDTTT